MQKPPESIGTGSTYYWLDYKFPTCGKVSRCVSSRKTACKWSVSETRNSWKASSASFRAAFDFLQNWQPAIVNITAGGISLQPSLFISPGTDASKAFAESPALAQFLAIKERKKARMVRRGSSEIRYALNKFLCLHRLWTPAKICKQGKREQVPLPWGIKCGLD